MLKVISYSSRSLVEQSLVQRLSGLGSLPGLQPNRHPFLSLQRPSAPSGEKLDIVRVTDNKDDDNDDDDLGDDDDEKRKKKKTRTVFSRSQVWKEYQFVDELTEINSGFPTRVNI